MSDFILVDDYKPAVRAEILDAVIRDDAPTLEMAEDRAIAEMKSYLGTRYDTVNIFNKTGSERNQLVLMFAIDITLYHLYSAINRMRTPEERVERYKRAIAWLGDLADGRVTSDLPVKSDPTTGEDLLAPIIYGSEKKYNTGW